MVSGSGMSRAYAFGGQSSDINWDPKSLAALSCQDATVVQSAVNCEGTGSPAVAPGYPGSVVTDSNGLAVSVTPRLYLPAANPKGTFSFAVTTSAGQPVYQAPSVVGNALTIPSGHLQQGGAYLWTLTCIQAPCATNPPSGGGSGPTTFGPFAMAVDTIRATYQPVQKFGPVHVDLATGAVAAALPLRGLNSASGPLNLSMIYRVGQNPQAGLPTNWGLRSPSLSLSHIQSHAVGTNPSGTVSVISLGGSIMPYKQAGNDGSYTPVVMAGQDPDSGVLPTLVRNITADPNDPNNNSFTLTTSEGVTATFSPPDSNGISNIQDVFNGASVGPQVTSDSATGKITSVSDPISGDLTINAHYYGDRACADDQDKFDPTVDVDGLLCAVTYPDESSTFFYYNHDATNRAMLARVVDYPQASGQTVSSVFDIAYDSSGRMVALRLPPAANVLAASQQANLYPWPASSPTDVLTAISYDSAGRASVVTSPLAVAPAPNTAKVAPTYQLKYAQPEGSPAANNSGWTEVVSLTGPQTAAGFGVKYTYDANSMLPLVVTDSNLQSTKNSWDTINSILQTTTDPNGLETKYTYNADTSPASKSGPYSAESGPIEGATPFQSYGYDQVYEPADPTAAKSMNGFNVMYWANSDLVGRIARQEYGPKQNNILPTSGAVVWNSNPVSGDSGQAWSARLTGTVDLSKLPQDGNGVLTLGISGAQLWIDNNPCQPCQLNDKKIHSFRIDFKVPNPASGGTAGFTFGSAPGQSSGDLQAVPIAAIAPAYGLPTTAQQNDDFGNGAGTRTTATQFDQPWTGQTSTSWVTDPAVSGIASTNSYEAFDPENSDNPQYGRRVSSTQPAGATTTYSYYGPSQEANIPCTDYGSEPQHGLPSQTVRSTVNEAIDQHGTQTYTNFYDNMGRTVASQITGGDGTTLDPACTYFDDTGNITKLVTPDRGTRPGSTTTITYFYNGDPLQTQTTVSQDGQPDYQNTKVSDLYGRTLSTTDMWNTRQTFTYDPATGKVLTITTQTASGFTSESISTYTPDGQLATVQLDGKPLASLTPAHQNQPGTVLYGNKVSAVFTPNDSATGPGSFGSVMWRTAAPATTFEYSIDKIAPSQRVLAESYTFGPTKASFAYTYDQLDRLNTATLDTSLPVLHKSWEYQFTASPTAGSANAYKNSNRTAQIIDGTTTINYGYDEYDRLTSSTDPAFGNTFGYDVLGEINQLGSLTIDYDGNSQVVQITDAHTQDQVIYNRVNGAIAEKITTNGGNQTTNRYSAGGLVLDGNNNPLWQVIPVPGGATLLRSIANNQPTGAQQWQHNTPRGQRMWTSDENGDDTGDRHLYSPFGEDLLPPGTTAKAPAATGSATGDTNDQEPDFGWQAGAGIETDQIGSTTVISMGARLYVPALGRFTSPDPMNQGSVNKYDYSNQDPINQSDTSGNMPHWARTLLAIVAVVALQVVVAVATAVFAPAGAAVGVMGTVTSMIISGILNAAVAFTSSVITTAIMTPGSSHMVSMLENWDNIQGWIVGGFVGGMTLSGVAQYVKYYKMMKAMQSLTVATNSLDVVAADTVDVAAADSPAEGEAAAPTEEPEDDPNAGANSGAGRPSSPIGESGASPVADDVAASGTSSPGQAKPFLLTPRFVMKDAFDRGVFSADLFDHMNARYG